MRPVLYLLLIKFLLFASSCDVERTYFHGCILILQNCSSGAITFKRVSRLPNRSNSASESGPTNYEKAKQNFQSTRHSSLHRSDTDMRQKSLFRSAVNSKQNSPVRELRRYSPRKSPSPSVSSHTLKKSSSELAESENDPMFNASRDHDKRSNFVQRADAALGNSDATDVRSTAERDDRSEAVDCNRNSKSSTDVEDPPVSLPAASTSAAPAVTIPAVITTTPENVCTEALTPVEANADSDVLSIVQHRRNVSVDEDDDKEKAVGASPDGRYETWK